MATNRQAQVNVRSDALKRRIDEVTARTSMSATRFLEEAAAFYEPQRSIERIGRLVRKGDLWVMPPAGKRTSLREINTVIDADRSRDLFRK